MQPTTPESSRHFCRSSRCETREYWSVFPRGARDTYLWHRDNAGTPPELRYLSQDQEREETGVEEPHGASWALIVFFNSRRAERVSEILLSKKLALSFSPGLLCSWLLYKPSDKKMENKVIRFLKWKPGSFSTLVVKIIKISLSYYMNYKMPTVHFCGFHIYLILLIIV